MFEGDMSRKGTPAPVSGPATPAPPGMVRAVPVDELKLSRGTVPPIVTKAGLRAFEVTYPAGQRGGGTSNANFDIQVPGFFPADEVRVAFKVFLDDSFPLTPSVHSPSIGGKLGGFKIGTGASSGGNYGPTAASYRVTWANEGGVLAYMYPQLRAAYVDDDSSNITWSLLDQTPGFQAISKITKGVHVFSPPGGKKGPFKLRLRKGTWNAVEMYCKLNAPGMNDGIMELVVNGARERTEEVRFRYTDIKIESWLFHSFFGGSQRPPSDTKAWFADFVFSRK